MVFSKKQVSSALPLIVLLASVTSMPVYQNVKDPNHIYESLDEPIYQNLDISAEPKSTEHIYVNVGPDGKVLPEMEPEYVEQEDLYEVDFDSSFDEDEPQAPFNLATTSQGRVPPPRPPPPSTSSSRSSKTSAFTFLQEVSGQAKQQFQHTTPSTLLKDTSSFTKAVGDKLIQQKNVNKFLSKVVKFEPQLQQVDSQLKKLGVTSAPLERFAKKVKDARPSQN
jgi:hypothetical protein